MDLTILESTDGREAEAEGTVSDPWDSTVKADIRLGALLFTAGAPGQRIIDSITVLNEKLRGGHMNVFLGFEALVITLERGVERRIAMCEYPPPRAVNGRVLLEISRYVRSLPEGEDPSKVIRDLEALDQRSPPATLLTFAAIALFTVIFGFFNRADPWALLIIGIAALLASLTRELMARKGHGYYMAILVSTLVASIAAALLSQVIPTATPLISLVIPCIFLIPGFQLINGGWEILRSHMHIGIPRIMVFLNVLAIMGVGLLAVLLVYTPGADGVGISFPVGWALVIDTVLGALAALCFCGQINTPRQVILVCLLCGAAGRFTRTLVVGAGGDVYLGVFCGTLIISVLALLICTHWQLPIVLPLVAASVQFIPGYYIIISLQGMAQTINLGQSVPYEVIVQMISTGLLALFIAVAIILGTLLPLLAFGKDRRWY